MLRRKRDHLLLPENLSTFQQHLSMGILMLNMRRPLSRDISLETTGAKFRSKLSFWAEIERNQDFATCVSTVGSYQCLKAKREIIYSNYLEDNKMSLFCELIWFLWNNSCLFMSRWDYFLHSLSLLLNVLKSSTKEGCCHELYGNNCAVSKLQTVSGSTLEYFVSWPFLVRFLILKYLTKEDCLIARFPVSTGHIAR